MLDSSSSLVLAQTAGGPKLNPWSSWFIGVQGGYTGETVNYQAVTVSGTVNPGTASIGLYGGRSFLVAPNLYGGVSGSFNYTPINSTNQVGFFSPQTITTFDGDLRFDAGYLVAPNIEAYGFGGFRFIDQQVGFPGISQTSTRIGWELGGGVKTYVGSGFYGKVEVSYFDMGSKVYVGDLPVGMRGFSVRVGVERHFGKDDCGKC